MSIIRGSEWRKWDLHIHTPASIVQEYKTSEGEDIWEKFIGELENLPQEIKVIGINDYLFLDGYKKVLEYRNNGRLDNIDLILPVVEFRLKEFVGHSKLGRINYHIIFSNELHVEIIEQQFLSQLYGQAILIPNESSATWGGALSKKSLTDLGKSIKETTPDGMNVPNGSDLEIGFNNLNFELSKIEELLNNHYLKGKYLKAIGKTEWDDFRWDGSTADKKTLINGCDFVFIASPTIANATTSKDRLIGAEVNSKILHCSDAHEFYESEYKSKVLGHCFTWIKADPTFEGLKQVIYEPEARLRISENKPQEPLHKLEKVKLDFRDDVRWDNDRFCFASFNDFIVFSPNLTCIIGGRGSGKSTLLNLIANKTGKGDTNFFNKVSPLDIDKDVIFEPDTIDNIEFLAQNKIEQFATDTKDFTEAIYTRLNKMSNGELKNKEFEITTKLNILNKQIKLLQQRKELRDQLLEIRRQLKINFNIVKTFSDNVFIDAKDELTELQKKKAAIDSSREQYKTLFESLKNIKDSFSTITDPKNKYDEYYNEMLSDIHITFQKYKDKDYSQDKKNLEKLKEQILRQEKIIENYLRLKGLSSENIDDAKSASQNIVQLQNERKNTLASLCSIREEIKSFSVDEIDTIISEFEHSIESELEKINTIFEDIAKQNPDEVKLIEVKYEINKNIFEKVFEELESILGLRIEISSFRKTFMEYLSSVDLNDVLSYRNGSELIDKIGQKNTQAYQKLFEIFSNNLNFNIYKLLIEKHQRDMSNNKILRVYYDEKPLDNSSFGQKCTAAIVVLLSLGNNPIIIDEPEAHLDSSLIANYLVELIKQQKEQRQIIFATHNANFVLNADAELIIKLDNTDGTTSVTYITIEDIEHRKDLLKLEGGKEAFKKREQKYNLN